MVVVHAADAVDVQRDPRGHGERVEDVRDHLAREVADLFPLLREVRPVKRVARRTKSSSATQYGREEMSTTARDSASSSGAYAEP